MTRSLRNRERVTCEHVVTIPGRGKVQSANMVKRRKVQIRILVVVDIALRDIIRLDTKLLVADVRFWLKTDIDGPVNNVRYYPESRHTELRCPVLGVKRT